MADTQKTVEFRMKEVRELSVILPKVKAFVT